MKQTRFAKTVSGKCWKWGLLFVGVAAFGILPSGCETAILRLATPLLI